MVAKFKEPSLFVEQKPKQFVFSSNFSRRERIWLKSASEHVQISLKTV